VRIAKNNPAGTPALFWGKFTYFPRLSNRIKYPEASRHSAPAHETPVTKNKSYFFQGAKATAG
jgi:hypothetical protein